VLKAKTAGDQFLNIGACSCALSGVCAHGQALRVKARWICAASALACALKNKEAWGERSKRRISSTKSCGEPVQNLYGW
jgi:hypothetical protein